MATAEVAAVEEEIATAEADLTAAQAAFEAAPSGSMPAPSTRQALDRQFMARRSEQVVALSEEKRRLGRVVSAAREAVRSAQSARRAAAGRGSAAEQAIERHRRKVQSLREAYEDDTWDLLAISQFSSAMGQDVSPRSILIAARREAEEELARREAGE